MPADVASPINVPVLAVQNVKGGVGKTTIAVNLAALLTKLGKRVLLIDADPQCNASQYLLTDERFTRRVSDEAGKTEGNLYDLFHKDVKYLDVISGKPLSTRHPITGYEESIIKAAPESPGSLTLICASAKLFEIQEIAPEMTISRIRKFLSTKSTAYDQVIIDCPPSISSLTLSAFYAADKILVPMFADAFSMHGLPILTSTLSLYREIFNIKAKISGVALSMVPPSNDPMFHSTQLYIPQITNLCTTLGVKLLRTTISKDPAYPQSFVSKTPLPFSTDPDHASLIDELRRLATDIGIREATA